MQLICLDFITNLLPKVTQFKPQILSEMPCYMPLSQLITGQPP